MADVTRRRSLLRLGVLVALVAGGALAVAVTPLGDALSREGIGTAVEWLRASPWAPLVFIAVYAAATALAMPGSILTLAGGAVFGVFWGTIFNSIAANLGANAAFGVSRFLGRDGVQRLAGERLQALDRATENHGFRGLLTLRLIPAVPFNALNFGSGLTAMSWPTYALATVIGIFPGTLIYTFFADALLAGSQEASREAFLRALVAGLLLVALSFLPTLARRLGIRVPGGGIATAAVLVVAASALFAPGRDLAAQDLSDPSAFTAVLREVVVAPRIDYQALQARRPALDAYLADLAQVRAASVEAASREAKLAFWINAYNACMLRLVADHYPIRKSGGLLSRIKNAIADRPANSVWQIEDVFTRPHCEVAGVVRSQDDIEHGIIRPLGDPRIHFAVNCAARSCPPLWPEAYTAGDLDAQLDRAVHSLMGNAEHLRVERDGGTTVRLNKVLDWFKDDFGGIDGLRSFLVPYVDDATAQLLGRDDTRIEFFDYDWTLNDVAR